MKEDPAIVEKLITARVGLLLKQPFFGNMATRMQIKCADDWCPTAATDGRNFYYNTKFVEKLSVKKLEFLFAHEICHCVFDHFGRVGSRDRQMSNIAQDFAVNQILVDDRIGERITEVKICQDNKYRGMAWEEIYDDLMKNVKTISLDQLGELLDQHINEQEHEGQGAGKDGKDGKGAPVLTKEEAQAIRDEIKQAMVQSAAAAGAGKTPLGIQRLIKDLTEPKMNWREILRQQIQSTIKNDYTFMRPNRKAWHMNAILPGTNFDETIDICVAIDMSGSIGDDQAKDFISEVKGIMDEYKEYKIKLWCFKTYSDLY